LETAAKKKNWLEFAKFSFLTVFFFLGLGFYWLTIAMTIYGRIPWLLSFLFLFFLVALWSLFHTLVLLLGYLFKQKFSVPLIISIPCVWILGEWFREYFISGLPWVNLADSQALGNLYFVQMTDITGRFGVTWILVATNVFLANLLLKRAKIWEGSLLLVLLLVSHSYGIYRLHEKPHQPASEIYFRVAALQGNIGQDQKWERKNRRQIVQTYEKLARTAESHNADLALWPEAAFPFVVRRDEKKFPYAFSTNIMNLIGAPGILKSNELVNSAFLVDQKK